MNRSKRTFVAVLLGVAILVTALMMPGIVSTASALSTASHADPAIPTSADGLIPAGHPVSVFDDHAAAVTNLNPLLLAAVRQAATDASPHIRFVVNSGWRSPKLQDDMLQQAIKKYGSRSAAERWVATPEASEHVKGDAVDIGPVAADDWLTEHGASYGLCRIYQNEAWHFELRPEAASDGCPLMYADPAHDPRMRG